MSAINFCTHENVLSEKQNIIKNGSYVNSLKRLPSYSSLLPSRIEYWYEVI